MMEALEQGQKRVDCYGYRQSEVLGSGSYSVVYRGRRLKDGGPVAIKVVDKALVKDELVHENIKKEISIMSQLDHPHIVKFQAVFQSINNIYIVMEYCNGGTLLSLLRAQGRLEEPFLWALLGRLVWAFRYLVARKILHRDIKPENILIHNKQPKLIDFGFSCSLPEGLNTVLLDNMGTPLYMSPQLLLGESYSPRSDVWSLGILVYQLYYGNTPWPSKDKEELVHRTMTQPLRIRRGPSPLLIDLIIGCLKIKEAERLDFPAFFALVDKGSSVKEHVLSATQPLTKDLSNPTIVSIKSNIIIPTRTMKQRRVSGLSAIFLKPSAASEGNNIEKGPFGQQASQESTQPQRNNKEKPSPPQQPRITTVSRLRILTPSTLFVQPQTPKKAETQSTVVPPLSSPTSSQPGPFAKVHNNPKISLKQISSTLSSVQFYSTKLSAQKNGLALSAEELPQTKILGSLTSVSSVAIMKPTQQAALTPTGNPPQVAKTKTQQAVHPQPKQEKPTQKPAPGTPSATLKFPLIRITPIAQQKPKL